MASMAASTPARPSSTPRDSSVSSTSTVGHQKQAPNGIRSKASSSNANDSSTNISEKDQLTHDRLLFLLANFIGLPVRITTKAGQIFTGIFSSASFDSPDSSYILKMVKQLPAVHEQTANGVTNDDRYIGHGEDHIMTFAREDVNTLSAADVTLEKGQQNVTNGVSSTFRTDTDISGYRGGRERELQPWQPFEAMDANVSLNGNGSAGWDQFETNERLYGVKTDYDENLYTTSIDRSAPSYKQRAAAAERKAREIEGSAGGSFQSREDDDNGLNEEERFSGVRREPQPLAPSSNRYTTPARRAPTGQPTIAGAPFDPAIISSQLARPDSASRKQQSPSISSAAATTEETNKENVPAKSESVLITPTDSTAVPPPTTKPAEPTKAELSPQKPTTTISKSRSPGNKTNATETVAVDVLESFKSWSTGEKMKVQEQQRKGLKRDKDVKINDLKKFALNFKLKRPVPADMLGILAKDTKKQEEIVKKSQQELEEKQSPSKVAPVVDTAQGLTPVNSREEATGGPGPSEPSSARTTKTQANRGFQNARNEKFQNGQIVPGGSRGGAPSTFGQRMRQQYAPGPMPTPQMPPTGPAAIRTDIPLPRGPQAPTPNSAASSRFNVQAMEFKPNPAAPMFSPPANPSSVPTSQVASRSASKAQSPSKKSFFEKGRPKPLANRRNIRDGFNPITRMKKEVEADGKTKDNLNNDGIPPAYTTRPTWEVPKENEGKTYMDMLERANVPTMAPMMPPNGFLPHQHQLPLHLQQNAHGPPPQGPQHTPRFGQPPMHAGQRDHHYDEHRMQYSQSQHSMYSSPRVQHNNMNQSSSMGGHGQPMYMQPQFVMAGPNGQMMPYRPGPGGPPPMMNAQQGQMMPMQMHPGPGGGQYMNVPGQPGQMMYPSPGPGQAYPAHGGPQGQSAYSSPRPPPMMMHQNSQQGHGPPMMYPSGSQQGQPMYFMPPQNQQMGQMRGGGYPMQPQGSYGASPHMQYQQPMHRGGPQSYGNFPPQQQMHSGQPMHQQGMMPPDAK